MPRAKRAKKEGWFKRPLQHCLLCDKGGVADHWPACDSIPEPGGGKQVELQLFRAEDQT